MAATKTLRKRFHSFEEEEKWLNEFADLGWRLVAFGDGETNLSYTFELDPTVKGMHYKIDYRRLHNKSEFEDYMSLFEETGWQAVPVKWNNYKYIFIAEPTEIDIYSDRSSLVEREKQHRMRHIVTLSVLIAYIIGCAIWYYVKGEDFIRTLLLLFSLAAVYFAWANWGKTKKMKQLRGE